MVIYFKKTKFKLFFKLFYRRLTIIASISFFQAIYGMQQDCNFTEIEYKSNDENSSVIYYACVISNIELTDESVPTITNISSNTKSNGDVKMIQYDDSNVLEFIPHSIFGSFSDVEVFEVLPGTGLSNIKAYYLKDAKDLKYFSVTKNKITRLEAFLFSEAPKLQEINLSENKIMSVHRSAFSDLPKLQKIYLQGNRIQTIDPNTFAQMLSLSFVDLSRNNCINKKFNIAKRNQTDIKFQIELGCEYFMSFKDVAGLVKDNNNKVNGNIDGISDKLNTLLWVFALIVAIMTGLMVKLLLLEMKRTEAQNNALFLKQTTALIP